MFKNSLSISHYYIEKTVKEGDVVLDATCGNGNDTLFLAKLVGVRGHVYSFDVQEDALNNAKKLVEQNNVRGHVNFILDGHQNLDKYVEKPLSAGMFNLGYLPGGNHEIHTQGETTIPAISKSLALLRSGGILTIVIYYGGDSGFDEQIAVCEFIKTLDPKKFSALKHSFENQPNCPPIAVVIQRLGTD